VLGEDAVAYFEPLLERARGGERVTYERQRPVPDGQMRWVRGALVPDYGRRRRVKGIYLVVHDISRPEACASRARSARKPVPCRVMDGIPAPVAYINRAHRVRIRESRVVEFSEIEQHAIKGRTLLQISSAQGLYARQAPLLAQALAGERISYERLTPFAGRPPRWMQVRLVSRARQAPARWPAFSCC
jgi:hypothetical protein